MAVAADILKTKLQTAFPGDPIDIQDLVGDQDHYAVTITSAVFQGKNRLAQHQMVYAALGPIVGRELHAISITTRIPEEPQP